MAQDDGPALALRRAIDGVLDGASIPALRRAAARLTAAYRRGAVDAAGGVDRLAYVAARLPSTFAATRAALAALRGGAPGLTAASLLELGAGPAPGLWAADALFPALARATHLEIDPAMAALGRRLLASSPAAAQVVSTWQTGDIAAARPLDAHDLVLAGYVLGELPDAAQEAAVDAAWAATAGGLVLVEPGTPAGAARILRARARLVAQGAAVAAPCPHAAACPLPADDWCHFGVRVARSAAQRRVKGGALAYEDEKYAYVALTRRPAPAVAAARVLRRPALAPRRVALRLCTADGLRAELVTRRDGARYRAARKVRWGGAWPPAAAPPGAGSR